MHIALHGDTSAARRADGPTFQYCELIAAVHCSWSDG
jgi:hypothetical protein